MVRYRTPTQPCGSQRWLHAGRLLKANNEHEHDKQGGAWPRTTRTLARSGRGSLTPWSISTTRRPNEDAEHGLCHDVGQEEADLLVPSGLIQAHNAHTPDIAKWDPATDTRDTTCSGSGILLHVPLLRRDGTHENGEHGLCHDVSNWRGRSARPSGLVPARPKFSMMCARRGKSTKTYWSSTESRHKPRCSQRWMLAGSTTSSRPTLRRDGPNEDAEHGLRHDDLQGEAGCT
jgi:hypothetical protein